jgi:hypothetical protein
LQHGIQGPNEAGIVVGAEALGDHLYGRRLGIGLLESQLLLAAVAALPAGDAKAIAAIGELGRRYRVPNVEAALCFERCERRDRRSSSP